MIVTTKDMAAKTIESCHGGLGSVTVLERIIDLTDVGIGYINETVVPPGSTIGRHGHENRQELYIILDGVASYLDDGTETTVRPGDICVYDRDSGDHALTPIGSEPVRMLVIGVLI